MVGLKPEFRETYLELHREVWPQVEASLKEAGIDNYSIFVHGTLLVSYLEYAGNNFEADMLRLANDPITVEWNSLTDRCQIPLDGSDGQLWSPAEEVWHLD